MGTRNITAVMLDGEYKIAQYGQWDGYPDGQGRTAFEFAQTLAIPGRKEEFKKKVRACRWITKEEIDAINADIKDGKYGEHGEKWTKYFPELSRDTCADILEMVQKRGGLALKNDIDFVADGLFCEYVWLIDLDANTFEGFAGFNKDPDEGDKRFAFLMGKCEEGYYTPTLLVKYDLDHMPPVEEFLDDCKAKEDE